MEKLILVLWVIVIVASCTRIDSEVDGSKYYVDGYDEEIAIDGMSVNEENVETLVEDTETIAEEHQGSMSSLGEFLSGHFKLMPIGYRGDKDPIYYNMDFDKDPITFMMKIVDKNGEQTHIILPVGCIKIIEDGTISEPYIKFKWTTNSNSDNSSGWSHILKENILYINIVGSKNVLPQLK